jgi:DNA-binding transcriptional regulator YdaS (Cro superfamily)
MRKSTVLKHYETAVAVARALGISEAAVSQWGELVPPITAKRIARLNPGVPELRFDPRLYRHSSRRTQQIAAALSA